MEVPSESFCRSSWDSRTCYPWRTTNQELTNDWLTLVFVVSSLVLRTHAKDLGRTINQLTPWVNCVYAAQVPWVRQGWAIIYSPPDDSEPSVHSTRSVESSGRRGIIALGLLSCRHQLMLATRSMIEITFGDLSPT